MLTENKARWVDHLSFPVRSQTVRSHIVTNHDMCPECGGSLDTGWECNKCRFDAKPEVLNRD